MNTSQSDAKTKLIANELVDRLHSEHEFYKFEPHKKQQKILESSARIRAAIGANRTGKSEIVAYICASHLIGWSPALTRTCGQIVLHKGPQQIWMVSPDANVSRDVAEEKIRKFLPDEEGCVWKAQDRIWRHPNGNSLGFKSCDSGREKFQGATRTLIAFDEEPHEQVYQECYARTIDCSGRMLFAFTPLLGSVWLHDYLFHREDMDIFTMTMGLIDNPYIPVQEIEIAKRQYSGDELRIRVYGDYILRIGSPFFDRESLDVQADRAHQAKVAWCGELVWRGHTAQKFESEDGRLTVFKAPKIGRKYAIGVDVASGDAAMGDWSCIQVIDTASYEQVAVWHGKNTPGQLGEEAVKVGLYYNTALIAVEVNSFGMATQMEVERLQYGNLYIRQVYDKRPSEDGTRLKEVPKFGWFTDLRTKRHACSQLRDLLIDNATYLNDKHTINELRSFGYLNDNAPSYASKVSMNAYGIGAVKGHDDRVIALAIAVQCALQVGSPYQQNPDARKTVEDLIMEDVEAAVASSYDDDDSQSDWDDDWDF